MSLSPNDVRKVARLARLGLDESAVADHANQLSSILDLVDQLERADTENIEPMSHPLDLVARLRPDVPVQRNDREAFQNVAPDVAEGLYCVPKVIE